MKPSASNLILGFSSIAHAFAHLSVLLYATLVLALEHDWGGGYAALFALGIPMTVMFGGAALPAGWLADRWSQPGMIAVFFLGTGASAIFAGLATSASLLLVALTLIGIFAAIYHPVGIPWLVQTMENPGRSLGLNGVFGSLGTAAASGVAGLLAGYFGWRAGFWVPGAVMIGVGLAFVWTWRSGLMDHGKTASAEHRPGRAGDMRRFFLVLAVTVFCAGLVFQITSFALPKIFEERLGALVDDSVLGIGGLVTLVYGLAAISQLVGGELSDRYPIRNVYVSAILMQVPVMLAAYWLMSPALIGATILMAGLNAASQPAENALLARFSPPAWHGRAFGAKFVLTLGVSAIGVSLIPIVHKVAGSLDPLFLIMAAIAAIASLAAVFLPKSAQPLRAAPAASLADRSALAE